MRISWAAALLAVTVAAAGAAQSKSPATSLEKPFAAGGRIAMDLSAGEYEITGAADPRIRLDWDVRDPDRLDDVDNRVTVNGTDARVSTDGPSGNFRVRIQVPTPSNLRIRLTAGEMAIKGIEGDKDVELHAGELDIDVVRAEDYGRVDAGVWAGEIHASAFRITKEGLFRSFDWSGKGKYRLHAHLKAGELKLHSSSAEK
jgi:hypothetical protein